MRLKRAVLSFLGVALVMALGSPAAMADTTHAFVKYITVASGGEVEPEGVDDQGNLIVWLNEQHAVAKFDPNGNPVNFSALGSNVLDGAGGHDCLHTPADCDRVPTNGFPQTSTNGPENVVAVDHSGGPADGYIYVMDNFISNTGVEQGDIDVFAPSGEFLGTLDESQVTPEAEDLSRWYLAGVSVASNGVIYVLAPGPHLTLQSVNRFVPIDGVPSHDQFGGQLRAQCANSICVANLVGYTNGAGGPNYYYAGGEDNSHGQFSYYMRYPQAEFHRPGLFNTSITELFPPDNGPFGNGGVGVGGGYLSTIAIDPVDQHVYIGQNAAAGETFMQEWDEQNHQIGPSFGFGHIGLMDTIAFDRSGGLHDGDIYVRGPGSTQIAVFGPPVTIPDIHNPTVDPGHTTAQLSANIGLAGGPNVTDCHVDYGFNAPGPGGGYTSTSACNPATPYAADKDVTVSFSGLTPETDYHYRIVVANANGVNQTNDMVFHTLAVLGVHTEPATNLTRTSVDLNGSLNPDGMATTYHFEYGSTTQYNNRTPEQSIGSGVSEQALPPEGITGLQGGRTYHFRLVAKNSLGRTKSADGTFTVPANPTISGVHAKNVTESSADVDARINPLGYSTTYRFEYGVSINYESKTEDVVLGSQLGPQPVSVHLAGLRPGFVYHYRVVATNKWGTTSTQDSTFNFFPPECPNSHIRQLTNANYLPDCRAYELVSPGEAGNATLFPGDLVVGAGGGFTFSSEYFLTAPNASGAATAPSRFGFLGGIGTLPGLDPPDSFMDRYVATRTPRGWVTTYPGTPGDKLLIAGRPLCSRSMDECIDYRLPGLFGGGGIPSQAPYLYDVNGKSLGRLPTNFDLVPNADQAVARGNKLSADFSHFVFTAPGTPFTPDGLDVPPGSVYDNDIGDKSVVVASKLPGGGPIPQEPAGGADPNRGTQIAAVSANGTHILMGAATNPYCEESFFNPCPSKLSYPAHLYMRIDGAITDEVSPMPVTYRGMTENGSKVFFTSEEHVTNEDHDSSVDLYEWDESTDSVKIISQGNGEGDVDDCTAFWDSSCDVKMIVTKRPDTDESIASQSGDIYFYSPEQLDPANPGVRNERNLYVYRDGAVHYVTTLDPGTLVDRMQVSPDGDHMALLTRAQLTSYSSVVPNLLGAPTQAEEMYVFNPSTGEVNCASCLPSGEPPSIVTTLNTNETGEPYNYDVRASESGRFMSDDGRVAFTTADALVPADTNRKMDVYEFANNRAQLITTGTGDRDTQGGVVFYPSLHTGFESISHDGVDLYFSTFETLVPEDHNGAFVKFYDARSGGGFQIDPGLLPCTAADECHGDASEQSPHQGLGTVGDLGEGGNKTAPKHHKRHRKHHHKRKHHHRKGHRHG